MKKTHRQYSKISLEYFQACYVVPEEWEPVCSIFNEEHRLLADDCCLRLRLKLDNKTIWSSCNIDTLLEMADSTGEFYPFSCYDCGDPGCAGIFSPSRIIHSGEDIILCLHRPLQENGNNPRHFRAYRLRKKDFFKELLAAANFRISMEKKLNIDVSYELNEENKFDFPDLLTDVFGFKDCPYYQYEISQKLRKVFPKLKNELMKMMEKEIS